jgi:hypothetical protein
MNGKGSEGTIWDRETPPSLQTYLAVLLHKVDHDGALGETTHRVKEPTSLLIYIQIPAGRRRK